MTQPMSHDLDRRVRDLEREVRRAHHRTRTIAVSAVALTLVAILHDTQTAAQGPRRLSHRAVSNRG
jgi:hypothetical protein